MESVLARIGIGDKKRTSSQLDDKLIDAVKLLNRFEITSQTKKRITKEFLNEAKNK